MSTKDYFDVIPDRKQELPYNENGINGEEYEQPEDEEGINKYMTTAPLPIGFFERLRFGLIWGLNLAQQDFEKYLLYFLLTKVAEPACDYYSIYSEWIIVAAIISYPINILSGWLTDYTGKFQHRVQQIALGLQTLALFGLIISALAGHSQWGQFFYQVRQAAMVQSMTSVWKLLKIRIDVENARSWVRDPDSMAGGRALDVENVVVSGVGNFGDIASESIEMCTLGCLYLMSFYFDANVLNTVAYIITLVLNIIPLILSFTIKTKDLRMPAIPGLVKKAMEGNTYGTSEDTTNRKGSDVPHPSEVDDDDDDDDDGKITGSSSDTPPPAEPVLESSGSSSVPSAIIGEGGSSSKRKSKYDSSKYEEKGILKSESDDEGDDVSDDVSGTDGGMKRRRGKKSFKENLYDGWMWVWVRVKYTFVTMPVINTMVHSVCVLIMYYMMTYPITLLINTEEKESSYSESATLEDYCHGTLSSLLRQGVILMVCYLVLSFMYMALLVRCPPRIYYKWILGILEVATGAALIGILLFRNVLPAVALNLLVSFAQILPYYINAYTYYVMNTAIRQDYYGFILALYAFGSNAVIIVADYALYLKINTYVLVVICIILMGITWAHGFMMRRLFYDPNWAEKAAAED